MANNDLASLFMRPGPVAVPPTSMENKENAEDNNDYKLCNRSIVNKNTSLKAEVTSLKRKIEELRKELLQKDEKIALLESDLDQEKIDFLVAERFKKKVNHMNAITERTILGLSKAAEEYMNVFSDMKVSIDSNPPSNPTLPLPLQKKPPAPRPKSMALPTAKQPPLLERIQESPLVKNGRRAPVVVDMATPKINNVTVRRTPRSARLSSADGEPANNVNATPRGPGRTRSTPSRPAATAGETDTVRRKRQAASKITSLAEPSLNSKLRRPGKFDEPTPYISTDFI